MMDSCRFEGKRTWRNPTGEWGVTGMAAEVWHGMPAPVYAALHKLMELEHPNAPTRADRFRSMTDEDLADLILRAVALEELGYCKSHPACDKAIENNEAEIPESWCRECVVRWLQEPWDERYQCGQKKRAAGAAL